MTNSLIINLIFPYKWSNSYSMFVYWENISNSYKKLWYNVNIISCPKIRLINNRLSDLFTRYIYYPIYLSIIWINKGWVFHIIDHSYAYLWMSIFYKKNKIVTCHDLMPLIYPKYVWRIAHMLFYMNIKCLSSYKHIITDSENTKKDLINILKLKPEKITTIPLAYNKESYNSNNINKNSDKFTILLIGSSFYKNIKFALEWISEFIQKYKISNIRIIKIHKFNKDEQSFINKNLNWVEIIEKFRISNEEVASIYKQSDLLIFPSLYEWFWLPILEALACWVNVITTRNWSLEEVWWDACIYVWTEIDKLCKYIHQIYDDELWIRNILSKKWKLQCEKFNWETTANLTLKIYEI
ncbi:MAG: Glycosyl transferase, group 1 family protein [uncultured bacterium (gcode 4)]|uniref:Glycosyl transferase, group 1 family protein n=1 Tax=uncultured bacterium (gcode 4) TaxID=1234023 RepID=K2GC13_9BACT|nr:MAG: Glycosyl transferase, group 1 family protein [uncultured bacterium (gcode 4)]